MERCIVTLSGTGIKETDYQNCYEQLSSQNFSPKVIIFYSDYNDLWYYAKKLKEDFPEAISIGCSTCINFSTDGYSEKGLSAMAIYSGVECSAGIIYEIDRHPKNYIQHVREAFKSLNSIDNTVCLSFTTAGSEGEELVLDTFEEVIGNTTIKLAGSSAGGDGEENHTIVALNGDIYIKTCVFIFIHNLEGKIQLYRENLFRPTSHFFTTTDVDCEERRVYELDNKPAADVLASVLNTNLENLPNVLKTHPMGRIDSKNILISDTRQIMNDGSIIYYSRIYNQTKVVLMEIDNFDSVWDETNTNTQKIINNKAFSIAINCVSRTNLFKEMDRFEEFQKRLTKTLGKYIGVSGFGEQIMYNHLNQSLVLVMFE